MDLKQPVPLTLTREQINVLQQSLERAKMEIAADLKMNAMLRTGWLDEIADLQRHVSAAELVAVPVENPSPTAVPITVAPSVASRATLTVRPFAWLFGKS